MTAVKEACSKGHSMTAENTRLRRGVEPVCRKCSAEYTRRARARRKERERRGEALPSRPHQTTRERLLSQTRILPSGCWEWTGFVNKQGYGRTYFEGDRSVPAQQAVYRLLLGPIPEGKVLDHYCHTLDRTCPGGDSCHHRRCVNPAHMDPVTFEENSSRGAWGRKTHCPHGHPYDEANTLVSGGRRYCRICARARSAKYKAKKAGVAA